MVSTCGYTRDQMNNLYVTCSYYSSGADRKVKLWDMNKYQCVSTFETHSDQVRILCVEIAEHRMILNRCRSGLWPIIPKDLSWLQSEMMHYCNSMKFLKPNIRLRMACVGVLTFTFGI